MNTSGLVGQFGSLGSNALTQLFPQSTGLQLSNAFGAETLGPSTDDTVAVGQVVMTIRASTTLRVFQTDLVDLSGIIGDFGLLGSRVMGHLLANPNGLHPTHRWTESYLGPAGDDTLPGYLTLDWVQHAHPFAWTVTAPPEMLSLDWVKGSEPFATNSNDQLPVIGIARFQILADLKSLEPIEQTVTGTIALTIVADTSIGEKGRVLGSIDFQILADLPSVAGIVHVTGSSALDILADTSGDGRLTVRVSVALLIKANTLNIIGSKRTVRQCEFPGPILTLSSNLPYGLWQESPNAMFTWEEIYTCLESKDKLRLWMGTFGG